MSPNVPPQDSRAPAARLAEAQCAIRRLTARGRLSHTERLELAAWQRQWVQAWHDSHYVIAA